MWRNLLQKSISGHVDAPLPTLWEVRPERPDEPTIEVCTGDRQSVSTRPTRPTRRSPSPLVGEGFGVRALARPFSPHPDAQPDYTQRMTHSAHTPIPLDFMSETRFMTEKSSTSATRQPAICRGDRSGRPSNKQRSGGQCLRDLRNLRDHQIKSVSSIPKAITFPA